MLLQGIKALLPTSKKFYAALKLSLLLCVFGGVAIAADSVPIPSKRPETFYASPELLKEIKRRMDSPQAQPRYQVSKSKRNNYEVIVKDTDKDAVLQHLQDFDLEDY